MLKVEWTFCQLLRHRSSLSCFLNIPIGSSKMCSPQHEEQLGIELESDALPLPCGTDGQRTAEKDESLVVSCLIYMGAEINDKRRT